MNRGVDEVQGRLSPYRRLGIGDNSRGRMVPVTSSSFSLNLAVRTFSDFLVLKPSFQNCPAPTQREETARVS
jgi:hypothetical protein